NGGGIRIGLEDNIYFDSEKIKKATNLMMLERMNKITGYLNISPCSPKETREKLNLMIGNK
ncbi:MAG: 3-keto-5-aminohexanoate cleavage protein, partial [bacterium]